MITNLLIVFCIAGCVFVVMAIPLMLQKIPPGPYGLRMRATLQSSEIWYPANAYAARRFLCVGVAVVIAAVAMYNVPGITLPVYATVVLVVMGLGFALTIFQSLGYVRRLSSKTETDKTE